MKYVSWLLMCLSFVSLEATVHSVSDISPSKGRLKVSMNMLRDVDTTPKSEVVYDIIYDSEKDTILGVQTFHNYKEPSYTKSNKEDMYLTILPEEIKLEWSLIAAIIVAIFSFAITFDKFLSKRFR